MARRRSSGLRDLERRFKAMSRAAFDDVAQTMEDEAEIVLARSRDLAPQLTGDMIAHSDVLVRKNQSRGELRVTVEYDEPYALFQHEGYYNPGPVTRAKLGDQFAIGRKFLSRAFEERREHIVRNAGRALERALRTTLR